MKHLVIFIALVLPLAAKPATPEWHFVPPAGIGVANVKDYGAKGDGKTDDTEAILKAISENIDKSRYRANPFIWFPNGTYLVSDSIEGRIIEAGREEGKVWSAGWRSMFILIGETRNGAVIKLKDKAPGFSDPSKPKWLLATGSEHDDRKSLAGGGNRAFRHNILNLTVDVGNDNPGAVAIDFIASNRGSVDGVSLLRAGKNSGKTAIGLTRWWPGPAMILDVSIEGFDHAFQMDHYQYGMNFENITIRNTRKTAFTNTNNVAVMRNIDYEGDQPFYTGTGGHSVLCLLDSTLTYTGKGEAAAITTPGILNFRRVTSTGFTTFIDDTSKPNKDLAAKVGEPSKLNIWNQGFIMDNTGKEAPLDLPIEEIPTIRPPKDAEWTDGGTTGDTLQAAIDSGAEYIFIRPVITLKTDKTIILRKNVKLIMGMHGHIEGPNNGKPVISLADGKPDVVCLEHLVLSGGETENASSRTLVLRHADIGGLGDGGGFKGSGSGKTHVVDVIGRNYRIGPKHRFWARQLNAEFGPKPLFTNAGTSCILGFKLETSQTGSKDAPLGTPAVVNMSGQVEIIGGLLYTLGSSKGEAPSVPAFTNERGTLSISYRTNGQPATYYPIILRQGSFKGGKDIPASEIKGNGAALLFDKR